jgi:hypothetical protein
MLTYRTARRATSEEGGEKEGRRKRERGRLKEENKE